MKKISSFNLFFGLILVALAVLCAAPFLHIFSVSISSPSQVVRGLVFLLPRGFYIKALKSIMENAFFLRSLFNSIYYVIVNIIVSLLLICICAYPLTKEFPGKRIFIALMLITMFFGGGMIPNYILIDKLGMIDTVWALVLPGAVSPFYVIIVRTFFKSISKDIEDAAKIDGSSEIGVLFRIVIPLSKPIIATISLFVAVGQWNSFFAPLIYLTTREKQTLQLFLRNLLIESAHLRNLDAGLLRSLESEQMDLVQVKYAATIVSIIPILLLYPVLQKYFVKGLNLGAIKE